MRKFCLLSLLLAVVLFGQIMLDEASQLVTEGREVLEGQEVLNLMPIPFMRSSDETFDTLRWEDNLSFGNSCGISGGATEETPTQSQTYGFATYFILDTFGITTPYEVVGVMLFFGTVNQPSYNFRLYVWNNVTTPVLRPVSHGVHLYYDPAAVHPASWSWGYYDLSSNHIAVPETIWVGICYNHLPADPAPADWYLGLDAILDYHTRGNLYGSPTGWVTFTSLGYPDFDRHYGVRLVVKSSGPFNDVGTVSIDVPATIPLDTTFAPQSTVENFGTDTMDFNVTCKISPGTYTSSAAVNDLAPGNSVQVTFPDLFNFESGFYKVTVFTQLGTDQNLTNDTLEIFVEATGIAEDNTVTPRQFVFNAPTICKSQFSVEIALPTATNVDLTVYNASGRLCSSLVSGKLSAGTHIINSSADLPGGVYFINLKTSSGISRTRKLLLIQ